MTLECDRSGQECNVNPDEGSGERSAPRGRFVIPPIATFMVASVAMILVFASSGTPVPLYNLYRTGDGIADADLAITTVVYLVVTATTLLILGRLSDYVGRKPVAIFALLSSAIGCVLLSQVHGLPLLLAGRACQGLACGLAASSLGSYIVDTAPRSPRWLGPLVTGSAPTLGIPLGALVSGVLVETAPAPRVLGYDVVVVLLVVVAGILLLGPETMPRSPGAWSALRPRVELPGGPQRASLIAAIAAAFVATWSFSGFYQAFAPALTADHLGTSNSVAIAAVFASIVVLSPVGGSLTGRLGAHTALRVGSGVFTVAVLAAVLALHAGSFAFFLGSSLSAGLAMGAATTGAMRALLADATPVQRAGLLSSAYLISYVGAAVPGLIASTVASSVELTTIAGGYAGLVVVAAVIAVATSTWHTRSAAG